MDLVVILDVMAGFRVISCNILALMKVYIGSRGSLQGQNPVLESLGNQSTANDEVLDYLSLYLPPIIEASFEKAENLKYFLATTSCRGIH